jgi:hypothetical protein
VARFKSPARELRYLATFGLKPNEILENFFYT